MVVLTNSVDACEFSSSLYVQEAVNNADNNLDEKGMKISVIFYTIPSSIYHLEMYSTPDLIPADSSYLQSLIGIIRCSV